jgi:ATP-dependent protease HslVU (ClpYQ) peptidase subunit
MYGDLQWTNGGHKWKGNSKVFKIKARDGVFHEDFIVGMAGTASDVVTVANYFQYPEMFKTPPRVKSAVGLVLTASREIYRFDDYRTWFQMQEPCAATGSGMEYALGAMLAGKSPKEAVKIAMKHDAYTGMGVKGYRV